MMRVERKSAIVLIALLAAGCGGRMSTSEMVGAGLGLAAGGAIGYQFGGGLGQALSTAAGALIGGTAGYVIGRRLSPSDRAEYDRTAQQALAEAPDGGLRDWSNPSTGNSGIIRPVRSYHTDGRLCRQYRATVAFDRDVLSGTGTACLQADGQWLVVSDAFS
jgi:surface antigen